MNSKESFFRASNNPGALLNTDNDALKAYKANKAKSAEINNLKKDFSSLKEELSEIKNLLRQLVNKE